MSRRRKLLLIQSSAALLICAAIAWVGATKVFGFVALPDGLERHGNFTIKSYRTQGFGHTGHRSTLYYRRKKIAASLTGFAQSPVDPERALYTAFCDDGRPGRDCGVFYMDGHRGKIVKIEEFCGEWPCYNPSLSPLTPKMARTGPRPWSSDGRFVMIPAQYKLLLVDLATGEHTDLAEQLDAQAKQDPMPPRRFVSFTGWSPDVASATILRYTTSEGPAENAAVSVEVYDIALPSRELNLRCTVGPAPWGDPRVANLAKHPSCS